MISTVNYRFLLEGREIGAVSPGRGLRQGDPLSPYLFILIMDVLHNLIQDRVGRGMVHGISIARGAPKVTNLFFADDCYVFFKASVQESNDIKEVIQSFLDASGQEVNLSKSSITFSKNVSEECRRAVSNVLNIREGNMNGNYLGLP